MATVNSVVPKETLSLIRSVADREKVYAADKLVPLVRQEIDSRWSKSQREIYTGELRLSTKTQIQEAVYVFCQSINWESELNGLNDMPVVSETGVRFIHSIATKIGSKDKDALFDAICDAVAEDEENNNRMRLSVRMAKMGLKTTNDIYFAIDLYHSYLDFGLMGGDKSKPHQRENRAPRRTLKQEVAE